MSPVRTLAAYLRSLRPRQWTKNGLVFAGVIFAHGLTEPALLLRAIEGFVAFSLLSGSVYLFNDLQDIESDRLHPRKRHRPVATGELPFGLAVAGLALAGGLAIAPSSTAASGSVARASSSPPSPTCSSTWPIRSGSSTWCWSTS